MGLPGILAGLSIIMIHLSGLRSFGVSYLEPFISANKTVFKDTIVRNPWWSMTNLPGIITRKRIMRMRPGMKPSPNNGPGKNDNSK
jgi:spore germination protein KA